MKGIYCGEKNENNKPEGKGKIFYIKQDDE